MNAKDWSDLILNILAIIGIPSLLGATGWLIWQGWRRRVREKAFPFVIITNPEEMLPALLPGTDLLADHAIPYQQRRTDQDAQLELRTRLRETGYLLVHGPTGLGKTREVGMLARALCAEGATVLLLRRDGWLDVPADWPPELRHKNLLFIIDDITFHCAGKIQHPRAGEMVTVGLPDFQERLRRTLDWFIEKCGEREVRALATARDEPEYWDKLGFSERDSLWRRFVCFRLKEPEDAAVARLLKEAARQAGIPADPGEFPTIAAANDSTFANAVANLRLAQREGRPLTLADYQPHAQDTWAASYQAAMRNDPAAKYVYDALDLLAQAGMATRREMVVELGTRLWGGGYLRRLLRRRQVRRTLAALVADHVLAKSDGLIRPRDGQVEAKGYALSLADHFPLLTDLTLWAARRWGKEAVDNIYGLGEQLWRAGEYKQLARLLKRGVAISPGEAGIHNNLGLVYSDLKRREQAIAEYQRAIELDPKDATPHNNLGIVYSDLGRHEEAVAVFQRAIELDPKFAYPHNNLGNIYSALGHHEKAIIAYQRAIELDPKFAYSHNGLGNVYTEQGRTEEAIAAYRRAIELAPMYATPHNGLGNLYRGLRQHEEAIAEFRRAIALDLKYASPHHGLGNVYRDLGWHEEAIAVYEKALEIGGLSDKGVKVYNSLGCVCRDLGRYEEAIAEYLHAIELDPKNAVPHLGLAAIYYQVGDGAKSQHHLAEARRLVKPEDFYNLACLESIAGNVNAALEHLAQALEQAPGDRAWARRDPDLAFIRDDPRFRKLVGEE